MATQSVRCPIFGFRCNRGHVFDAPKMGDFEWGEFLAYGALQSVAFINSWIDPVWNEAASLVDEVSPDLRSRSRGSSVEGDIVQAVYSATLDPGPAGPLAIGPPPCPVCGLKGVVDQEATPNRWQDVPHASHTAWLSMDRGAKLGIVSEVVARATT